MIKDVNETLQIIIIIKTGHILYTMGILRFLEEIMVMDAKNFAR